MPKWRTGSSSAKVYSLPSSDHSPQAHLVSMHSSACLGDVKLGLQRVAGVVLGWATIQIRYMI